ncbi:MAG: SLC13 family permease [Acidimicrobiales bacterium]
MTTDAWVTLATLAVTFALLVLDRFPPAGIVVAATTTLLLVGVIDAEQAFAGLSNPAPITVAALFVLAAAAERTGLLAAPVARLLGEPGRARGASHLRLLLPTAGASAVFNNTPLVAMLIPDVVTWCRRNDRPASRYLLPLSYAAILGGTLTVLGTSTNLVVSGLVAAGGDDPLGMFELAKVGGPVAAVGLVVLFTVTVPLLPSRAAVADRVAADSRAFTVEMRVRDDPSIAGATVEGAGLRHLRGVYLVQLRRAGRLMVAVGPDEILLPGDVLTFAGQVDDVLDLQRKPGLESVVRHEVDSIATVGRGLYEVVVGRMSPVAGRTLREADFRARYGAAVVAIHRAGHALRGKLGDVRLRHGDTLVVVASGGFRRRYGQSSDFLVVADLDAPAPTADAKAVWVAAIGTGFVALTSLGVLATVEGALLAAGAVIAGRIMTFAEAKRAVDLDVILLIGAAFGLGAAVDRSGLAITIADLVIGVSDGLGTFGLVLGIVVATSILTELVTNNAAAVVVFPIAVAVADAAGLDARVMAIGVAIAASTSFLSPIGYQTNTMVYGPGGYRVIDYVRGGLPLSVAVQLTIATAVTAAG